MHCLSCDYLCHISRHLQIQSILKSTPEIPAYQHGGSLKRKEVESIVKCSATVLSKSLHDFSLACHIPNLANCWYLIQVINWKRGGGKRESRHMLDYSNKRGWKMSNHNKKKKKGKLVAVAWLTWCKVYFMLWQAPGERQPFLELKWPIFFLGVGCK